MTSSAPSWDNLFGLHSLLRDRENTRFTFSPVDGVGPFCNERNLRNWGISFLIRTIFYSLEKLKGKRVLKSLKIPFQIGRFLKLFPIITSSNLNTYFFLIISKIPSFHPFLLISKFFMFNKDF